MVVPMNASMKLGFITVMSIDFMAVIPLAGSIRLRAGITNDENAKKIPATMPLPTADAKANR